MSVSEALSIKLHEKILWCSIWSCTEFVPLIAAMPKIINKAKVACLDFSLQKAKMKLGVSVVIDDPVKLAAIRDRWVLNRY